MIAEKGRRVLVLKRVVTVGLPEKMTSEQKLNRNKPCWWQKLLRWSVSGMFRNIKEVGGRTPACAKRTGWTRSERKHFVLS